MPGNVDLQKEKYNFLLENARGRADAMVEYASGTEECRSRWLLRYFGQEETEDCGSCDVCRARRTVQHAVPAGPNSHSGPLGSHSGLDPESPSIAELRRRLDEGEF